MKSTTICLDRQADDALDELAKHFGSRSASVRRAVVYALDEVKKNGPDNVALSGDYTDTPEPADGPVETPDRTGNGRRMVGRAPAPGDGADVSGDEGTESGVEPDAGSGAAPRERGGEDTDGARGDFLDRNLFAFLTDEDEDE